MTELPPQLATLPTTTLPDRAQKFLKWTREIATTHRPNMAAFVVIVWEPDGGVSICGDVNADENPIPRYLLPAWISEHVRAEFVTASEVKLVLRDIGILTPRPTDSA